MRLKVTKDLLHRDFLLICTAAFVFFSCFHLLGPLMPLYFQSIGMPPRQLGLLVSSFMFASLAVRPFIGKYADELNQKFLLLVGVGIFAICCLGYVLLTDVVSLLVLRIIQGIGYALFTTVCSSWVTQIVPKSCRAEGLGHYSNALKLAMAVTPGIGLVLVRENAYWFAFLLCAVLCLVTVVLTLPVDAHAKGLGEKAKKPKSGRFFNGRAIFPGFVMLTNGFVYGALIPFVPMIASEKNLPLASLFFTLYAVALVSSRSIAGRWADSHGRRAVILPGMALVGFSMTWLALSPSTTVFLSMAVLYGLGAGLVQPSLMALVADKSRKSERGSALATFTMLSDLGVAAGSGFMGWKGATFGYANGLLVSAGVLAVGLVAYQGKHYLKKKRRHAFLSRLNPREVTPSVI